MAKGDKLDISTIKKYLASGTFAARFVTNKDINNEHGEGVSTIMNVLIDGSPTFVPFIKLPVFPANEDAREDVFYLIDDELYIFEAPDNWIQIVGGTGGSGHKYTFKGTATGWKVLEDGKEVYTYTDKDTNTTYTWQATDEGWTVKDNTGKIVFTYKDKIGTDTTYTFEETEDYDFEVKDNTGKVIFQHTCDESGTTYTFEQKGVNFTVTNDKTNKVVFDYKGTEDTNTTYTFENYKDGFKVLDNEGTVVYLYDPQLGKMSDGSYAIDTLLTTVIKGHTTISTGQIAGFTPSDLVVGETLVYDGVGTVGVITLDNGDGTYQVTTMTISPGTRQGVRLGSVQQEANLPTTITDAETSLGWQTPQLGDFAYVTEGGQGDEISEYVITNIDTSGNITWTFSHSFNAGDYQSQSTAAMSGMILTGGAVQGTFGTPIDPSTLIRGVLRNGVLLTPDAQGKVNVQVDDSHIIVNQLPTTGIVDLAEYVVIDNNLKVTGTWVHDSRGWFQTYEHVSQVKAHQIVSELPKAQIEENVEYVIVDDNGKISETWVYDTSLGWIQTEIKDKSAHIIVAELPLTDIDDEAEYVVVGNLNDAPNTYIATYVHNSSGWIKVSETSKATAAHIAVTILPTTNINENAEYLVMTDLADPSTLTGTYVRVNGNWVQTEKIENGYHLVTALPTTDIDDKHHYVVVGDLTNPDTTFLGEFVYDKTASKWIDLKGSTEITYNVGRDGQELKSADAVIAGTDMFTSISDGQRIPFVNRPNSTIDQEGDGTWIVPPHSKVEVIMSLALYNANGGSEPNGEWCVREVGYTGTDRQDPRYILGVDPYDHRSSANNASGWSLNRTASGHYTNTTDNPVTIEAVCLSIAIAGTQIYNATSHITVQEIGRIVDPIAYMLNDGNAQEMPVGSLIQTMSNSAPKHYLICDGSEYAIGTYPELEAHFVKEFGAVNHFGGGNGKWKVPDLRGEFLRMTGTNSHINQGSGAGIGEHQDGTYIVGTYSNNGSSTIYLIAGGGAWQTGGDYDNPQSEICEATVSARPAKSHMCAGRARPTNTSVNVAIKCESTPRVIVDQGTYKASVKCSVPAAPSSGSAQFRFDGSDIIGDTTMVDTTTNEFVAPVDGLYVVGCQTTTSGTGAVSNYLSINGTNTCWGRGINPMGTVYLKTGDRVSLNMYGGSSAQTGRANIALVNTVEKNIAEVMLKPNTWAVGVEQNFGDGVYGMRVSGTFSSSISQDNLAQLGAGAKPISSGGSVSKASTNWSLPFVNANSNIAAQSIGVFTSSTGGLCVRIGSDMYKGKYDIWCLYTKD